MTRSASGAFSLKKLPQFTLFYHYSINLSSPLGRAVPRLHYHQANSDVYKQNQSFTLSDINFERVDAQSARNQSVVAPGPVTLPSSLRFVRLPLYD